MARLDGSVAVVTGAASGMGAATVEVLAGLGALLVSATWRPSGPATAQRQEA